MRKRSFKLRSFVVVVVDRAISRRDTESVLSINIVDSVEGVVDCSEEHFPNIAI